MPVSLPGRTLTASNEGIDLSSSEEQRPRKTGRLKWLLVALVILVAGWIGGWLFVSKRAQSEFDIALARLNRDGVIAQCANREVRGFPFSVGIYCDSLNYEDDSRQVFASSSGLRSNVSLLRPTVGGVALDGPFRLQAPNLPPLWINWASLDGEARLGWPLPKTVSLTGTDISTQTDPEDESAPVQLFRTAMLHANCQPNGDNLDCAGNFSKLDIAPEATAGHQLPGLDGSGEATVVNGIRQIAARPNSFRGQAVEIKSLSLASGEGSLELSGPISVDADGLLDARLKVTVRNPGALSDILQKALPEHGDEIKAGLGGLALFSKEISLPLTIAKGTARLGPIALGQIDPLD